MPFEDSSKSSRFVQPRRLKFLHEDSLGNLQSVSNASVLQKMPSKLYEFLAVFVVGSSIIVALIGGTPQNDFLELLTLLAISAYRVMPSMSRINGAIMQMNGQNYLLDIMELGQRHVATMQSNPTNRATSLKDIAIKINDLTLSYQESDTPVVEHLNKQFDAGKVHAIVGPSGCGKSTIVGALLGLLSLIQVTFPCNAMVKLQSF